MAGLLHGRVRAGMVLAALTALAACSETADMPMVAPNFGLVNRPFNGVLPQAGDGQIAEEQFQVCKYGSSGTFDYTVIDRATRAVVATNSMPLADGECQVIAVKGGQGQVISITESAAQSGFHFDHVVVDLRYGTLANPTNVSTSSTNPTVVDSITGGLSGDPTLYLRGLLVKYYNAPNPPPPSGSIGDFVWLDANGNGIQDAGEAGIAGVTVTLGGAASATTTTDANGNYLFSGLSAGSYTVTVGTPSGTSPSPSNQGGDPTKDSNGSPASVTLATNSSSDLTIDFGFVPPPPPPSGQIGDFVWLDANGNGIQDAGEAGIAGVTVTLGGAASATTTTDANGNYLFSGLSAGSYTVTVGTPSGTSPSPSNQGGDPTKDSNGSPASVTLATNSSSNLTIDFGFVPPPPPTGQIGDFVWSDENGNGVQDAGEPGLSGVQVTLSGAASATTTTDANGYYLFTGLVAGSYTVTVATPNGMNPSPSFQGGDPLKDSNGSPASVTLPTNSSSDLSIDFGFVPTPALGRMTGGGAQIDLNGVRISRGFTLHCDITLSNNLEINWPGTGRGASSENNFHITRPLRSAQCILDPQYRQPPPVAPFNTFIGVADGTLNGVEGAVVLFTFVDAGEPGRNDLAKIQVFAPGGALVLDVPLSNLDHGNIQAHYDQPHGSKP